MKEEPYYETPSHACRTPEQQKPTKKVGMKKQ
jgi:hypothetical protein